MTAEEIVGDVSICWKIRSLGLYRKAISWYTVNMRGSYFNIFTKYFEDLEIISYNMLWILAYDWALLRWVEGLGESPMPKPEELNSFPLEVGSIDWNSLLKQDYAMMVNTYIHDLSHAWKNNSETFWCDENAEMARYLFQTCKQYLLRYGVAEAISSPI